MPDFESIAAVEKPTPHGGTIKIGVGYLLFEDGSEAPATAFEIKDADGIAVTQFALLQESFGVFMDTLQELYSNFNPEENEETKA
jgi:hypothetical protein